MGSSCAEHLGIEWPSVTEMTRNDWVQFLIASTAGTHHLALQSILNGPVMAKALIAPLQADCIVCVVHSGQGRAATDTQHDAEGRV